MSRRVVFMLEAPGKRQYASMSLRQIAERAQDEYQDFRVFATGGHVIAQPQGLHPLHITPDLKETGLRILNPQRIEHLFDIAVDADEVWIATDPDVEGDLIATDIQTIFETRFGACCPPLWRVRPLGLDVESLQEAIETRERIDHAFQSARIPGVARRIADRLIGALLSRGGIAAGRVQSAILGLCAIRALPTWRARLVMRDSKATRLVCDVYATDDERREIDQSMASWREGGAHAKWDAEPEPTGSHAHDGAVRLLDGGSALLEVATSTGKPVHEVAQGFQRLYEAGQLSYWRSDSRYVLPKTARALHSAAQAYGITVDPEALLAPGCQQRDARNQGAHEAPHPVHWGLPLHLRLSQVTPDDAMLTALARHQIEASASPAPDTRLSGAALAQLPEPLRRLGWVSGRRARPMPWGRDRRSPQCNGDDWQAVPQDRALLRRILDAQLGRPGTYVGHIEKFIDRELIDERGLITERGEQWAQAIRSRAPALLDVETAVRMEAVLLGTSDRDIHERVADALEPLYGGDGGLDDFIRRCSAGRLSEMVAQG